MSSPSFPSTEKWPTLYRVDRAKWQDMLRISFFIGPIAFVVGLATLFSYLYSAAMPQPNRLLFALPILVAILGFLITIRGAINFINSFYEPPEGTKTINLIAKRLLGIPPSPGFLRSLFHYPFKVINIAQVNEGKFKLENEYINWLGGPATLIVYDGTGVYIERGNQFSRTLGPGFAFLERFERVREIVDLRPQTMSSGQAGSPRPILGRTKDGIKIEFNISIKFHILRSSLNSAEEPDVDKVKPVNKSDITPDAQKILEKMAKPMYSGDLGAIKRAVESTTVRYREGNYVESKWREGVWGMVSGRLAKYVTQHYIDELITFENTTGSDGTQKAGQLFSGSVREAIREELDSVLQARLGVTLTSLYITDFSIPSKVYEQYHQLFDIDRRIQIKRTEGTAAVEKLWIREKKRAQAQRDLITEIADAFKSIDDQNFTDSVLLSLSSILDQSLEDTAIPSILAKDNLATLEQLRDFINNKDNN
jgi:hypothetical protein